MWAIIGFSIVATSWIFTRNKLGVGVAAIWVITALVGADEIPGIVNAIKGKSLPVQHPGSHEQKQVIRVATINCQDRNTEALLEAKPYAPDIVLIQASPEGLDLKDLAKRFYGEGGHSAGGWHCGIIARDKIKLIKNSADPRFTHVTLTLSDGRSIDLVSVHLTTAVTRWDLWNKDCWRTHYRNRKLRRSQVIQILSHLASTHEGRQVIFGGDFNAPASDAVYNILRHDFLDSYRAVGSGWGIPSTIACRSCASTNSGRLQDYSRSTRARCRPRTPTTRLLICDYVLN